MPARCHGHRPRGRASEANRDRAIEGPSFSAFGPAVAPSGFVVPTARPPRPIACTWSPETALTRRPQRRVAAPDGRSADRWGIRTAFPPGIVRQPRPVRERRHAIASHTSHESRPGIPSRSAEVTSFALAEGVPESAEPAGGAPAIGIEARKSRDPAPPGLGAKRESPGPTGHRPPKEEAGKRSRSHRRSCAWEPMRTSSSAADPCLPYTSTRSGRRCQSRQSAYRPLIGWST